MQSDLSSGDIFVEPIPHLGQLLLHAGLITDEQLAAVGGSGEVPPPKLGAKLVIAHAISHGELHEALYVQSLLREHVIDQVEASAALKLVRQQQLDVEGAFSCLGVIVQSDLRLGDLLQEAGVISPGQLRHVRTQAVETGYPISGILLLFGLVDSSFLEAATEQQAWLRKGERSRQQVINALSERALEPTKVNAAALAAAAEPVATARKSSVDAAGDSPPALQSSNDKTPPLTPPVSRTVRFTEFLILCGLLKNEELEQAQKMRDGTQFGVDTIVRKMHAGKNVLVDIAGYCYRHVQLGTMGLQEAIDAVDYCKGIVAENDCTVDEAAAKLASEYGIKLM
ncbi:MAG TPA: hypothetical protein V6D22_00735 [Candidatus Obscuribacterales bacterium]